MPSLKTYDLFISHAWTYNIGYYKLEALLRDASNFKWRNYSVPEHDPLIDPASPVGKKQLAKLLENQIKPVNCVLIVAGMFVNYREWMLKEIEIARSYNKPIIGVYPWGQTNMPTVVQDAAFELVGWNTSSIIDAIRRNSI